MQTASVMDGTTCIPVSDAYVVLYLVVVCPCHKNVSSWRVRPVSFICRSLMGPVNKIRPPQMSAIEECLHHNDTSG